MPFFDRTDRRLRDRWDQYLFGPDLLVAPVWQVGDRSREVYFPRGKWRSYWNPEEVYSGRRTVTIDVPLDLIPVFVRKGLSRSYTPADYPQELGSTASSYRRHSAPEPPSFLPVSLSS